MSSNKFEVCNVNDEHEELNRGVMEVTSTDLVYTFSGSTKIIVWSMKYLRRMGSKDNIFYFEAGRKCATGEGLYAFKCERASELHHLVCMRCGILAQQFENQSSVTQPLMAVPSQRSDIKFCASARKPPEVDHVVG